MTGKMRIQVKVKARAKGNKVERVSDTQYKIRVKAVPENGKANQAVIEVLSEYLKLPKSRLEIISGHTSANKVIEY